MKLLARLTLVLSLAVWASYPSPAAAKSAAEVATKLAEKVATAVLGDAASLAFDAIFGEDEDSLTLEDVEGAISSAFDEAATKEILGDQTALKNDVRDYNPQRGTAARDIEDIMGQTSGLQGKIDSHISKANSMRTIPAFVAAWNTRLAFAAERYRLNGLQSDKKKIAIEAVYGLEALERYLREDFSDPHRRDVGCVRKAPGTPLRINGAVGQNVTEKDVDVSRQYCFGNGRVLKIGVDRRLAKSNIIRLPDSAVLNLGGAYYMLGTDLGKAMHENVWLFAGKVSPDANNKEYFLEQSVSKDFAEMLRNQYLLRRYPGQLGDLHGTVIAWLDIVKATGDQAHLESALEHGMRLGIGWNTLDANYHNGDFRQHKQQLIHAMRAKGEHRNIVD